MITNHSNRRDHGGDRLPPHSIEAEQGLISCCFQSIDALLECSASLAAEAFYDLRHQVVYDAMLKLQEEGEPVEMLALFQRLKEHGMIDQIGGISYLNELADASPSASTVGYYLKLVTDKAHLRGLVATCTSVVSKVYNHEGDIDSLMDEVEASVARLEGNEGRMLDGKALVMAVTNDLERRSELYSKGERSGIATGWGDFDRRTDGLQYGEQTIIGARPSMGKTALAVNIVEHVCLRNQIPCAVVTLEMSPSALIRRLISSWCRIPMHRLRSGGFLEEDMSKISAFTILLKNSPLYIVDGVSGMNERQVGSELRRLKRKHGIKLGVIDYLQKCHASQKSEKKTYEVGSVSSSFKSLAKELDIALVTLAQLNRENEKDKGRSPRLSDLGDSKQLEQDGDLICLLHRPRSNDPVIASSLIVAKQRDGELGVVNLSFEGEFCRFTSQQTHE